MANSVREILKDIYYNHDGDEIITQLLDKAEAEICSIVRAEVCEEIEKKIKSDIYADDCDVLCLRLVDLHDAIAKVRGLK